MTDTRKVDTSKYTKEGKVEVDGKLWTVKLPGAGTELRISKAQRRLAFLEKKIESGKYDEVDLDRYDELEQFMFDFFKGVFTDSTKDNSEVTEWIENTPGAIIIQAFEDIKTSAAESDPISD